MFVTDLLNPKQVCSRCARADRWALWRIPAELGKLRISGVEIVATEQHLQGLQKEDEMKTYQKSAGVIARLNAEQYRVTQEWDAERPGAGEHLDQVGGD